MSKDMLGSLMRASVRLTQPQIKLTLDVVNRLTGDKSSGWEIRLKEALRAGPYELPDPRPLLNPVNKVICLDPIALFDPERLDGISVAAHILKTLRVIKNLGLGTLRSYDVNSFASQAAIDPELPDGHVFSERSELYARIQQLAAKQPKGEEGDLATPKTRCTNVFYHGDYIVMADWSPRLQSWFIEECERLDGRGHWSAGTRVFARRSP